MRPIVTLLTDFGTADGYVAELKGALLSLASEAEVVDASHDIAAQDIDGGRLALARYWRRFPPGTVHVVIIDPGVGSPRDALAVSSADRYLVGPDNGVLSPALLQPDSRAVTLPVPATAAPTFHGRDVFAPAAARLALGADLVELGEPHARPVLRRTPEVRALPDGSIGGEVISIDRFGNAITNLIAVRGGTVEVNGSRLQVRRTYAEVAEGAPAAVVGSSGLVEIAVRDGHAARALGLARGTPVMLRPPH